MSDDNHITILFAAPGKPPAISEIPNTLAAMQQLVGGYIEAIGIGNSLYLICNEQGNLLGLPPNRAIRRRIIAGNFFFTRADICGDNISLSEKDISQLIQEFFPGEAPESLGQPYCVLKNM